MAANELSFVQLSTILNAINAQATGETGLVATDTSSFITVAQATLKTGVDPVLNAISQVLSRTIFSIRPYNAKFGGLMVSEQRWGNHVRKLTPIDKPFEDDDRLDLVDGSSQDQYTINKPDVIQTNYYGADVVQKSLTIFKDQLDSAFSGPDEFGSFISMIMTNVSDMIAQKDESTARAALINTIMSNSMYGEEEGTEEKCVHLLTEYNQATGQTLNRHDLNTDATYMAFAKWAYARIQQVSQLMSERSCKYHINIGDKKIMRHSPYDMQKLYISAQEYNRLSASVLSSVFNPEYLRVGEYEAVPYWQAIDAPTSVNAKPVALNPADGTLVTVDEAAEVTNIFALLFDEEAIGVTRVNQWSAATPFNAKGGYTNMFWHFTERYWNDFTENSVLFTLD